VLMQETETARGVYGQSVAEKMSWTPGLSWFIPMCHQFFYVFFLRMMVWICLNFGKGFSAFFGKEWLTTLDPWESTESSQETREGLHDLGQVWEPATQATKDSITHD
jgi:hypothetical protein